LISKKFIRNSIIYTIAGSLPMASAIIFIPLYINYLSPATFGALSIYTGISLLVQIFVTFSFDSSVYTYYHDFKNDKSRLAVFISTIFNFVLLISVITFLLSLLTGAWLFDEVFTKFKILFYPYGLISIVTGIFQALFKINSNLLQTQEKAPEFLYFNLISFLLIVVFTIAGLLFFNDSLAGPITGRCIATGISVIVLLINIYWRYGFHLDFSIIKEMLGFNQGILVYQILQWFNLYLDRFLMGRYLTLTLVGIYDIASKCLMVMEFVIAGFNGSFLPKVFGMIALQKKKKSTIEINRYYNGLTAVSIILIPISILVIPFVINLMAEWFHKPGYASSIELLPYLALGYLFRTLRLYTAMPYPALKKVTLLPFYYLAIMTIKAGLMIWFLWKWEVMGVVFSLLIGYAIESAILYWGIRKEFQFEFNPVKILVVPMLFGSLILVVEPIFGKQFPILVHFSYLILGGFLLLWAFKNELKNLNWRNMIK